MVVKTPRGSARCGQGVGKDMSRPSTKATMASWAICNSIFRSPRSYSVIAPGENTGVGVSDGRNIALLAAAQDKGTPLALYGVTIDSPPERGKIICRRN